MSSVAFLEPAVSGRLRRPLLTACEMLKLAVLLVTIGIASAATGFHVEQALGTTTMTCMKNAGLSFYISRIWRSNGVFDSAGIQNIKNAHAAGFSHVDAYIIPCTNTSCAHASNQIEAALNHLHPSGASIGTVWLDVEICQWPADKTHNRQFVLDMANKATSMGYKVGIYTSNNNWEDIVGLDWTGASLYSLWWANYDGQANFNNFESFGGWSKPDIHQYSGGVTVVFFLLIPFLLDD